MIFDVAAPHTSALDYHQSHLQSPLRNYPLALTPTPLHRSFDMLSHLILALCLPAALSAQEPATDTAREVGIPFDRSRL